MSWEEVSPRKAQLKSARELAMARDSGNRPRRELDIDAVDDRPDWHRGRPTAAFFNKQRPGCLMGQHLRFAIEAAKDLTEEKRREVREIVKSIVARSRLADEQRLAVMEAISECHERKEQLASDHVAHCAPLQTALAQIEKQQMTAILSRAPHDAQLETSRKQNLDELRRLNLRLECAIDEQDQRIAQLEGERIAAALQCSVGSEPTESDLVKLGSPGLLAKLELVEFEQHTAENRLRILQNPLLRTPPEMISSAELEAARTGQEWAAAYQNVISE